MRGPGQCDREIKPDPESARPALSAGGSGDNPRVRSPARSIPLNLLRVLTPSPTPSASAGNHPDQNLVQATLAQDAAKERGVPLLSPTLKRPEFPVPRTPLPAAPWY